MDDWDSFDNNIKKSILESTGVKLIKIKPIKKIIEDYLDNK
jgi:hypothetical protein